MKRGILLVIIFIVIFTALNNYYKIKTVPSKNLNYAFFGDSHVRDSINPEFIEKSFNLGVGEENYIEIYYKIRELLQRKDIKIKALVLQTDIHIFSDKFRKNKVLFVEDERYNKAIPLINKESKIYGLSNKLRAKFPIIGQGKELITHALKPPFIEPTKLGWANNTEIFSLFPQELKNNIASRKYDYLFSKNPNLWDTQTLSYFLKTLELAKEKNKKIILIKYPITKEYNSELIKHNLSSELYYSKLFKIIANVTEDYAFLDYSNDFLNNSEYFGDSDHLNQAGAEVLSKKINEDLKKIHPRHHKNWQHKNL